MQLKTRFLDINRIRLVVSNRRSRKPGFFEMDLVKSNKAITDMAACIGKDQTMVQEILPNEALLRSSLFAISAQMLMYLRGAPASGGKNLTVSCIELWSFSRTWLICLEEMNPWQGLHHWAVLNDAQNEILAPVKLMELLPLISVRLGFHPGKGVKSTCMLSETEQLIKYIWCTVLLSIIDKAVSFKYKLRVSLTAKFKHVLLQNLKG